MSLYPVPVSFADTVGFTFHAEILCKGCTSRTVRHILVTDYPTWPVSEDDTVHDLVGQLARAKGEAIMYGPEYNTYDTAAFDPGDVPKAFESASVDDGEQCMCCYKLIADCD